MNDDAVKAFLEQFETSKKNIDNWPSWMQDSAKVASASFPKSHVSTPESGSGRSKREGDGQKRS